MYIFHNVQIQRDLAILLHLSVLQGIDEAARYSRAAVALSESIESYTFFVRRLYMLYAVLQARRRDKSGDLKLQHEIPFNRFFKITCLQWAQWRMKGTSSCSVFTSICREL